MKNESCGASLKPKLDPGNPSNPGWNLDTGAWCMESGAYLGGRTSGPVPIPLGCRRNPAAPVGALDNPKAPEAFSIYYGANDQFSATAPQLGRRSEDTIDPWGHPIVFVAFCIYMAVLINHSSRPQSIHRRCLRPKRRQISPKSALLYIGHRWRPSVRALSMYQGAPSWGCPLTIIPNCAAYIWYNMIIYYMVSIWFSAFPRPFSHCTRLSSGSKYFLMAFTVPLDMGMLRNLETFLSTWCAWWPRAQLLF